MYDVIIIGAGIGGLVCGCYLAKAGLKVLIVEQHHKPGGYCTSFKRKGITFDAAAHAFGGYARGIVGTVFQDLDIEKKLVIHRFDPSDTIQTPDYRISVWGDLQKTIASFQCAFPHESKINDFFHFLLNPDPLFFPRIRSWTFQQLLDQYFGDNKLKTILAFPLFGNAGLPPSRLSAFLGAKIYKEFLLDGGYYPEGGMQVLADAFAQRFKELGGELRLKRLATKIAVQDRRVTGVTLEQDGFVASNYVVSNGDARSTFCDLLGTSVTGQELVDSLQAMSHSLSMFILYLGLKGCDSHLPEPGTNMWILNHYDIDNAYASAQEGAFDRIGGYMMRVAPDAKSMVAFINSPFISNEYWKENKSRMEKFFMSKIMREAIPDLSRYIVYEESATPVTLYRYTLNYQGAAYGWEGTPGQLAIPDMRRPSSVNGLYLAGHWTTHGLGIPGVVYVGYDTSRAILRKKERSVDKLC